MNNTASTSNTDKLSNTSVKSESEQASITLANTKGMQTSKTQPSVMLRLAVMQLVSTVIFALGMYYWFDAREALSALFGGAIAVIGSVYSAGRLFTTKQDASAAETLLRFYISVVLKIIFTLALMVVCMIVLKVSMLPFIISYLIAAVIVNLLVLLLPSKLDYL